MSLGYFAKFISKGSNWDQKYCCIKGMKFYIYQDKNYTKP
jgi:hypothetical protein